MTGCSPDVSFVTVAGWRSPPLTWLIYSGVLPTGRGEGDVLAAATATS